MREVALWLGLPEVLALVDDLVVSQRVVLVAALAFVALAELADPEVDEMGWGRRVVETFKLMLDNAFVEVAQRRR